MSTREAVFEEKQKQFLAVLRDLPHHGFAVDLKKAGISLLAELTEYEPNRDNKSFYVMMQEIKKKLYQKVFGPSAKKKAEDLELMIAAIQASIDAVEGLKEGGDFEKAVFAIDQMNRLQTLLPGHERLAYKLLAFAFVLSLVAIILVCIFVPPAFASLLLFSTWTSSMTSGVVNPLTIITTTNLSVSSALFYTGQQQGKASALDGLNLVVEAEIKARDEAKSDEAGDIFDPREAVFEEKQKQFLAVLSDLPHHGFAVDLKKAGILLLADLTDYEPDTDNKSFYAMMQGIRKKLYQNVFGPSAKKKAEDLELMIAAIQASIDAVEGLKKGGDFEKAVVAIDQMNRLQTLLPGHERLAYKLLALALVLSLVAIILVCIFVPPVFASLLLFAAWASSMTAGVVNPLIMITTTSLSVSSALFYTGQQQGKASALDGFNLVVEAEVKARDEAEIDEAGDIFYPASGGLDFS